jgi:hypothetical protein
MREKVRTKSWAVTGEPSWNVAWRRRKVSVVPSSDTVQDRAAPGIARPSASIRTSGSNSAPTTSSPSSSATNRGSMERGSLARPMRSVPPEASSGGGSVTTRGSGGGAGAGSATVHAVATSSAAVSTAGTRIRVPLSR